MVGRYMHSHAERGSEKLAKYKDDVLANDIIKNWLRNRNTIEFLGI